MQPFNTGSYEESYFGRVVLVIMALFVCCIAAPLTCTSPNEAVRAATAAGFHDVHAGDYAWFACGDDYFTSTKFTAVNANGASVEGVVCCGWLKKCSVKF